ncbi:MAG: FAD-binding protein [Candidatus Aenigmarchaeota archaeon]|nr:FAD-binding protein [Candidatus Aenigmarchaeota archaeon]
MACDVLVIGSGGAGLRAAIELADRGVDVLVVGKSKKRDAHTILATGGINAALGNMDPQDSWPLHAADTIRDGGWINDPRGVELLCKHAPRAVQELAEWGARFHREPGGKITQRFFGAATYRRACFSGDHTGQEILNVLVDQAEARKIPFRSEVYIFSLLQSRGRANGAVGLDLRTGKILIFQAKAVILATGGHSRMFERSSSRFWENNGDGIALALQVGARFQDMEMFQFHPTGMVHPPRAAGVLVTEAVRGEGGILTNARGERFMKRYDPARMELSARDLVARAIYTEIEHGHGTRHGGVWLDISHRPLPYIKKRLPTMYRQFLAHAGVDISRQKMEVAPTAHYSMGGVLIDHTTGETGIRGLYAIGEVTAGMHGANRLGGNSLAEIMVFGRLTGAHVARRIKKQKLHPLDQRQVAGAIGSLLDRLAPAGKDPLAVKRQIQELMWTHVGVARREKEMQHALRALGRFRALRLQTGTSLARNQRLVAALDVLNMLPTCEMIVRSALLRRESRGAHYRTDFPTTQKQWKKNIICTPTKAGVRLSTRPIPPIPKRIRLLAERPKPSAHLLE